MAVTSAFQAGNEGSKPSGATPASLTVQDRINYNWILSPAQKLLHNARLKPEHLLQLQSGERTRGTIKLYCGIRVSYVMFPTEVQKSEVERCRRCCKVFKYPPGIGAPSRDPECRPLLGLPVELYSMGES